MGKFLKVTIGAVFVLIGIVLFVAFIAASAIDPDKYRGQIAEKLSDSLGRKVMLEGPLAFHIMPSGIVLTVKEAAIANPSWASRPKFVSMGEMDVGVALLPLLDKRIEFTEIRVVRADIGLESNANGQVNWAMQPKKPVAAEVEAAGGEGEKISPVSIKLSPIHLTDSKFYIRSAEGKNTEMTVRQMTFTPSSDKTTVDAEGDLNGETYKLQFVADTPDLMGSKSWPFTFEAEYDHKHLKASGNADLAAKSAVVQSFGAKAGKSDLGGQMNVSWAGVPTVEGNLNSTYFDAADFAMAKQAATETERATAMPTGFDAPRAQLFSKDPLPFDALKGINANLDVKFDELVAGKAMLKNVAGRAMLQSGRLVADFPAVQLGDSTAKLHVMVDGANRPAQLELVFDAPAINYADLMPLLGMSDFVEGKANAVANITSSGNTMRELAERSAGTVTVMSEGGHVDTSKLSSLYGGLATLVAPNGGPVGLNCLAARWGIEWGVVRDNGVLADTTVSTVKVGSVVNLGDENMDVVVQARPKISKVGDLVPPVRVSGPITSPGYTVEAASTVGNAVGMLLGAGTTSSVPSSVKGPAGQNACLYTLEHPGASSNKNALREKVQEKVNKLGGKLGSKFLGLFSN